MTFLLTPEQQQAIASRQELPLKFLDPTTQTTYVLVPEDVLDDVEDAMRERAWARNSTRNAFRAAEEET